MKNIYILPLVLVLALVVLVLILQKIYPGGYSDLLRKFGYKKSSQYENYVSYRNPTFGFEFTYPSGLEISESDGYEEDAQFRVSLRFSSDPKSNAQIDILKIQNSGALIQDYFNITFDPTYYSGKKMGDEIVRKETTLVDGVLAYKYPYFPADLPIEGYYQDRFFLSKDSQIFEIIVTWNDREKALYEPIYNNILSSFRFIEEDTIIEVTPTRVPVDFSQITSYTNDFLRITFDYVPNATMEPIVEGGETVNNRIYGYYVQHPNLQTIEIFVDNNPKNVTAKEWYMTKKSDYHPTLMQEIGEINEGLSSILIVGQPNTCLTAPLLVVFIAHNGKVYTLWQRSVNNEPQTTFEMQTILSNFKFNDTPLENISIPKQLLNYPSSENIQIDCPR